MNELEEKAVEDIEYELEVSKQFPYLHKPREVAKQLVLRCGYGKVEQYQEEIERLNTENTNLAVQLEVAERDIANLEHTMEEIHEVLSDNGISIDSDGNVNVEQVCKGVAKEILQTLKDRIFQSYKDGIDVGDLFAAFQNIKNLAEDYGVEVDE